MGKIKYITAREILNSKGLMSVEATLVTDDGIVTTASSPSGTSTGKYEAFELKDNDTKRFQGNGMLKAVEMVEKIIAPKLVGMNVTNQNTIDKAMLDLDGTSNKEKLGANAILPVSIAVCKAGAIAQRLPLFLYIRNFIKSDGLFLKIPTPLFNVINGGKHAFESFDFQEFMVIPATSKSYTNALAIGVNVHHAIEEILMGNNMSTLVADEGGFAPKLGKNSEALQLLKDAVDKTSYRFGFDVFFGMDAAANSFKEGSGYRLKDRNTLYSSEDLLTYYKDLNDTYHLLYLEDPFSEDEWNSWTQICSKITNTIIVGDDLVATNPFRLQTALSKKSIGGIIIKPNQIGTVLESLAVVEMARAAGIKIIVSHRSAETNEDFIADFAVGVSADYAKFGSPVRGERVAKYNRLLAIDKEIKQYTKKS